MASKKFASVVVVMCMVVLGAVVSDAAISCGFIQAQLFLCLEYLNGGPGPSAPCCDSVRRINDAANTTPDRQAACSCLKNLAAIDPNLNYENAKALPSKCAVDIPYEISPSIDCASVQA